MFGYVQWFIQPKSQRTNHQTGLPMVSSVLLSIPSANPAGPLDLLVHSYTERAPFRSSPRQNIPTVCRTMWFKWEVTVVCGRRSWRFLGRVFQGHTTRRPSHPVSR